MLFLLVPSFYVVHIVQLRSLSHTLRRQRVLNTLFKSTCSNGFVAFDVILCSCTKGRGWLRSQCLSFTEHLGTEDFCHAVFHSACFHFLSAERWMQMGVINNARVLKMLGREHTLCQPYKGGIPCQITETHVTCSSGWLGITSTTLHLSPFLAYSLTVSYGLSRW